MGQTVSCPPATPGNFERPAATLYFSRDIATENALDRNLLTPYLFGSWKKRGIHTFKLVQQGKTLQEFSIFAQAVTTLIPKEFQPQAEYERKLTIMSVHCLQAKRSKERRELLRG